MEIAVALVILAANVLLTAGGLLLFLPDQPVPLRRKEARRLADKYGKWVLAGLGVLLLHLLMVQIDARLTDSLGWDFAPQVDALERGAVPSLRHLWNPFANAFFSVMYIVVHPWMLYFPALLFLLSDEERPAKATLLIYPLVYLLALPFYLFFPATNVFTYHKLASPLFELFPQLADIYYNVTTANNTFPSLHVAIALLIANAARYSRNRTYRYFAYVYAASVTIATLYLAIHWVVDVVGGILIALVVGVFTSRYISTERLALQRVKPTPEEAQEVAVGAEALVERVQAALDARGSPAKALLVGSVAKDTYLRSSVDYDVFMLFPTTTPKEEIERVGLEVGRETLDDPDEKYAEHPYIHGSFQGVEADVVPCYAVADASQRMTAVDRTPFHTRLVQERLERDQRDQVRLLKAFMKGVGVYGAEAQTRGFSGYLCELLVLKYGSFRQVVKAGAGWKPGTFLVLDRLEGNPKFGDPLVFLDPVDARRNVASAVSSETLAHFAEACRAYLRREGLSYFFPRQVVPLPPDELALAVRRRRGELLVIRTRRDPDVLEDHLHDQLRKASGAVARLLERHGFEVRRATHEVAPDRVSLLLELPRARLPETVTHVGPPVRSRDHADRFRKTWSEHRDARSPVYEEEGRLKVERLREFRRAEDLVRAKLLEYDLGKHLNQALMQGFEVLSGPEVVEEDTAALLTRHLNRKKSWEV
ncbi:MAG TPA: CCA tRNA nucleotidyltransferase [Candidatus Thermoplasmatota archaeon]|nr:CCA tRNA nucleotidyltransferase [Candidatus Thermoplasmatota archaeon]